MRVEGRKGEKEGREERREGGKGERREGEKGGGLYNVNANYHKVQPVSQRDSEMKSTSVNY